MDGLIFHFVARRMDLEIKVDWMYSSCVQYDLPVMSKFALNVDIF